ncbi:uncharacterized protein [Anabrus simplex]|uniref:uncharacterized protein n=1 Tax=Anabrus simplex TaxID=316456 RepID=UPI0035A35B73
MSQRKVIPDKVKIPEQRFPVRNIPSIIQQQKAHIAEQGGLIKDGVNIVQQKDIPEKIHFPVQETTVQKDALQNIAGNAVVNMEANGLETNLLDSERAYHKQDMPQLDNEVAKVKEGRQVKMKDDAADLPATAEARQEPPVPVEPQDVPKAVVKDPVAQRESKEIVAPAESKSTAPDQEVTEPEKKEEAKLVD